jgi:hypothetical protein
VITIARRLIQLHPDPSKQVGLSLGIPYLPPLLRHLTGLDATHRAQRRDRLKGEALMLAGDEPGVPVVDRAQEGTGTAIAVLYPEVMRLHGLQHLPEHRALLRMAVFTGKDIAHEASCGLIDDEGCARQGAGLHLAQHFEASLTRFKAIAIQHFHPIPRQPGSTRPIELLDQRRQHRRTITYQLRRGVRLDPVEFVRDRDERGPDRVFVVPIRRTHRGLDAKDDLAEDVIDRRKQHRAGILLLGCPGKPGIELARAQDAF